MERSFIFVLSILSTSPSVLWPSVSLPHLSFAQNLIQIFQQNPDLYSYEYSYLYLHT